VTSLLHGKKERIRQMLQQYENLLIYLKEKGALLNTLLAENFLSKEDYIYYKVSMLVVVLRRSSSQRKKSPCHCGFDGQ